MTNNTHSKNKIKDSRKWFGNYLVVLLLKGIAFLPFCVLYALSDLLYIIVKDVLKYRTKVISENLRYAFPEKTDYEIIMLRNKFYHYLCDVSLEAVKLYRMTQKQMDKRLSFKGTELFDQYARKGKGVVLLAFHYNNWEWCSALQPRIAHRFIMVYNKMRDNIPMDNFLLHSREKWGGKAVQMGRAAKIALNSAHEGKPAITLLIADQTALANSQSWAMFLNREAAFFTGPEKIAEKTNQPVFFQHIRRLGRGRYELEYSLLVEEPAKVDSKEILKKYIRSMEDVIREAPEYYLWSHRRWKHSRPKNIQLIK